MRNSGWLMTFGLALSGLSPLAQAQFTPLSNFGANPGELSASYYSAKVKAQPTVVVLHGCTQNGEQFSQDSGFLQLAKQHKFNLLVPQQSNSNNIQGCFNWFSKQDTDKDSGELLSLKNMMVTVGELTDSNDFYVVGLSAGGAMASALMYNYPGLISAGAIVAGIPYPCADSLTKAIACMRSGPTKGARVLAQQVKQLQDGEQVSWPKLSIWTGTEDKVVNPTNASAMATQWLLLSEQSTQASVTEHQGYKRSFWGDESNPSVELVEIDSLGHGYMIEQANGDNVERPYLLKSVIDASENIIKFWQISQR